MKAKKILALLISAVMAVQTVPIHVLAEDIAKNEPAVDIIVGSSQSIDEDTISEEVILNTSGRAAVQESPMLYSSAAAVTSGEFKYSVINKEKKTAAITGYTGEPSGDLVIPEKINGYTVTEIGEKAFYKCSGFTGSLTIPDSVAYIGDSAFAYCSGFTGSLTIPDSVTYIGDAAFLYCIGFAGSLKIPNSITYIGDHTFALCYSLTGSLTIPDSVTYIGGAAFSSCMFTGSLRIPDSVTYIGGSAFNGCSGFTGSLRIPGGVASIGDHAFDGCSGFTGSLTIPGGVTSIGDSAFSNCSGMTGSLTIPDSVTSIGDGAFENSGFTGRLILPDNLSSIGDSAFYRCYGFTGSLTIPDGVTSIGRGAFRECSGFTGRLTLPDSVTYIDVDTFSGCSGFTGSLVLPRNLTSIERTAFYGCSGFTGSLTIPDGVTSIGDHAFDSCSGLTGSLTIPDSVTDIGNGAFRNCRGLTGSLTIPDGVTAIGRETFYCCWGFKGTLKLPAGITSIGDYAFYACSGFTGSLIIPTATTSIGNSSFESCSGLTGDLVIPAGVASIGNFAFRYCGSRRAAYFGEDVPSLWGSHVFHYNADDFTIYYPEGNTSGWTSPTWTAPDGTVYNTATFVTAERPDYDNNRVEPEEIGKESSEKLSVMVVDGVNDHPISAAVITFGEERQIVNNYGKAVFSIPEASEVRLEISADGYIPIVVPAYSGYRFLACDTFELIPEGVSAVIPLTCNDRSINTSFARINTQANLTASIDVTGGSAANILNYQLMQNDMVLAESTNGSFSVPNSKFIANAPVEVWMHTDDGEITKKQLNINVISFGFLPENISFSSGTLNVTVPDNIPLLGGVTFNANLAKMDYDLEIGNHQIKVGYNYEVVNKDLSKLNKGLRKWMSEHNRKTPYANFNFDAAGYAWLDLGDNGFDKLEGEIILTASYKNGFEKTYPVVVVVTIPVRVEVEVSVTGTVSITNLGYDFEKAKILLPEVDAVLNGSLDAKAGVGCSFASAGAYGVFDLGFHFSILPSFMLEKILGTGEIGLYAKAKLPIVGEKKAELPLLGDKEKPITLYTNSSAASYMMHNSAFGDFLYNSSQYSLNPRAYLISSSDWSTNTANGVLKNGIYDSADPQIVSTDSVTMMVFTDDNSGDDPYNFQHLVFSVWTDDGWSVPTEVDDNNLIDADYTVVSDGTDIWVIYSQASRLFTEEDEITDYASAMEISAARYKAENGTFEEPIMLTDNTFYDRLPVAEIVNGIPVIAWISNEDNNIFGMTAQNTLWSGRFENEEWTITAAEENVDAVSYMTIGSYDGENAVVVTVQDTDSNFATAGDSILVQYTAAGSSYTLPEGSYVNPFFCDHMLYWNTNGEIFCAESLTAEPVTTSITDIYGSYRLIDHDGKKYLLYINSTNEGENGGSDIFVRVGTNGTWSTPVRFTVTEGYVDSFDAVIQNENVLAVYRRTDVTFTEDSFTTSSDLCSTFVSPTPDLQITDIRYDDNDLFDDEYITLTIQITNNGLADVDEYSIKIGSNAEQTFTAAIACGETVTQKIRYIMTTDDNANIAISVSDKMGRTNTISKTLGFYDMSATAVPSLAAGKSYANIIIRNVGNYDGNGTVIVRENDAEGVLLFTQNISLLAGEYEYILLEIIDKGIDAVYIEVISGDDEYFSGDNWTYCSILHENFFGDVNSDGAVTVEDVKLLTDYFAGYSVIFNELAADVDNDSIISRRDAMILARYLAEWEGYTLPYSGE